MNEMDPGKNKGGEDFTRLEVGQVAEIRPAGSEASYWTYIKGISESAVSVWLPEINGESMAVEKGSAVELAVTLNGSEILLVRGTVKETGEEGQAYAEVGVDASSAGLEHRRRYLRVPALVPLTIRRIPDGMTPWGDQAVGRTLSLSPGGLLLETEGIFTGGEQVSLELELPGSAAEAVGIVLTSAAAGTGLNKVSVRFTYISDRSEAAITRVIYQYQRIHGAVRI